MNEETRCLAEDVATSLEALSSAAAPKGFPRDEALPSSITVFHAGRVLFSCYIPTSAGGIDISSSNNLINAFEGMMLSLPRAYVHDTLLRNLHFAYASLIMSFPTTTATASSDTSAISAMVGKGNAQSTVSASWGDIWEGTESLCGIYLSSVTACESCCLSVSTEEGRHELQLIFLALCWTYDVLSKREDGKESSGEAWKRNILKTLSRLLVHGLVKGSGKTENEEDMDEQLSNIMTLIENIQSLAGEYSCALGDMLSLDDNELGDASFVSALRTKFESEVAPPPQLQYLLAMLRSSSKSYRETTQSIMVPAAPLSQSVAPKEPQKSMTDIQIDHVKNILPALGDGYIEEALKCYNHDVERTLEALLQASEGDNSNVHPRLLTIPTNLGRKLRDRVDHYSANVNLHRGASAKDDGKEHAKIQKQRIKHEEQQAEAEAYLIENVSRTLGGLRVSEEGTDNDQYGLLGNGNEYNDDYDDQYDGIGDAGGMAGGIGGMDEGLYDVDVHNVHQKYDRGGAKNEQEMWRSYNKLIKDVDAESQFWEDNRNLNRGPPRKGENTDKREDGEGKTFHGPDKGKGGRLIGPDGKYLPIKRGGKKGRGGGGSAGGNINPGRGAGRGAGRGGGGGRGGGNGEGNEAKDGGDLSKVQNRRKNDNKAKIGNHHRKDRSTKKAAGGMVM
ncbi:hypothetical protein ACHAWF_012068 [Thalassiosira exigua]